MRKFLNFCESFALKGVIMKVSVNNCIDLICIIHYLSKTALNCPVAVKKVLLPKPQFS